MFSLDADRRFRRNDFRDPICGDRPQQHRAGVRGLTSGVHRPDRLRFALRAAVIAGGVLFGFALFGVQLLGALHVSLEAFRFAAGSLV